MEQIILDDLNNSNLGNEEKFLKYIDRYNQDLKSWKT